MKKDLLDYIKNLSVKDKKTLSQKALKTCEEVGELAKAILPFDSAHGTSHRFVDKEKVLEEIVDVFLTNISIAYSLGFTDEEIEEMTYKKALKWNEIQIKEEKAEFPLPFEIHITISNDLPKFCDSKQHSLSYLVHILEKEHPDNKLGKKSFTYSEKYYNENIKSIFIDTFRSACKRIGVKPIVIDLETKDNITSDVMTSSRFIGDNRTAYEESQRIVNELREHGFNVVRTKIETVPWHPSAPTINSGLSIPNGCYFESHIGVSILPKEKESLNNFVNGLNYGCTQGGKIELSGVAKLSRNFFKKSNEDGRFINILTYRSNVTSSSEFTSEVNSIKSHLTTSGFNFEKVEVEYAIYDTNVSHDIDWIGK